MPVFPVEKIDVLPDLSRLSAGTRNSFSLRVAAMADGSEICLPVNVLVGKEKGPRLLMVAGVHGNEYEGITTQLELWQELDPASLKGAVVMVPVANPPAFRAGTRRNPADEVDMNRVFPGDLAKSITHRLAHALFHQVLAGSDMLLSMHGWSSDGIITPYVEYPRSSPVTRASQAAARAFGLEYIESFDWNPGLLVATACQAGIPSIEPEIGGAAMTMPERRSLYKRGSLNLMRHLGILPGNVDMEKVPVEVTRSEIPALVGGIFLRQVESGTEVKTGQVLAKICDLNGRELASVTAPASGRVATIRLQAFIEPGDMAAILFHPTE
jgi:predicted deacylase